MDHLISLIKSAFNIDFDIDMNTPLISTGLIDSLHVAQLLALLGKEYGTVINTRDVGTDNFDTPRQIEKFLKKYESA
jgi:acyl carrier protein